MESKRSKEIINIINLKSKIGDFLKYKSKNI